MNKIQLSQFEVVWSYYMPHWGTHFCYLLFYTQRVLPPDPVKKRKPPVYKIRKCKHFSFIYMYYQIMYVYTCIRIIIVKLLHVSWNFVLVRWKVFNLFLHCFTGWPLNKFCHYKFTVKCYNTLATNFRDILYLQVMEKDISPVCCFLISSGQMSSQFAKEQFVGADYWTKDLLF